MQTATQSYSAHIYTGMQSGSPFVDTGHSSTSSSLPPSPSRPSANEDSVSLSPAGKRLAQQTDKIVSADEKGVDQKPLTEEDIRTVTELKTRDAEVRAHEQAHLSAAGQYAAGGASFSYTTGPDGRRYASGGEVPIDIAKEKTPQATILKMRTVRRAALAPANPSSADLSIAAQASTKEAQAVKEMQEQADIIETDPARKTDGTRSTTSSGSAEPATPEISDYSRKTMDSAYQTMAALGA